MEKVRAGKMNDAFSPLPAPRPTVCQSKPFVVDVVRVVPFPPPWLVAVVLHHRVLEPTACCGGAPAARVA